LMDRKQYEALCAIRGLAAANRYRLTFHAQERMRQRGLVEREIRDALAGAQGCVDQADGKWRVAGTDFDGIELILVVVLRDDVLVVTVF
jgi:hypothetical protein